MIVPRVVRIPLGAVIATLSGLVLSLVVMLATATPASAHAHLVKIDPANGAIVTKALAQVTLTFDETMRAPAAIVVTDSQGERVESGAAQVLDKTASIQVRAARAGRYTIAYRVVSADGHPVTGKTAFVYQPPVVESTAPSAAPSTGATPSPPSTERASPAADGREHTHDDEGGPSTDLVVGGIAGLALLGGVGLFAARRRRLGPPAATEKDPA